MRRAVAWKAAFLLWVGAVAGAAEAPATPSAPAAPIDEILRRLASYRLGGNCDAVAATEDLVRKALGDPHAKADLARKLTELLRSPETTLDAKKFICRPLRIIADAPEVPALAALLTDKDLADMARYAMERIPDPSAGKALLAALPNASPSQKVGLINSLGERGETAAVGELARFIHDEDKAVARAAVSALGRIGSVEAAAALEKGKAAAPETIRPLFAMARLACADRLLSRKSPEDAQRIYKQLDVASEKPHVRIHAARGLLMILEEKGKLAKILELLAGDDRIVQLMAADEARHLGGSEVCKALADNLPRLPAYSQALVLGVLADRGDAVAALAVVEAAKAKDDAVAISALVALGQVGDASVVPFLVDQAAKADLVKIEDLQPKGPLGGAMVSIVPFVDFSRGNAARSSLIALRSQNADGAILKAFDQADSKTRAVLANILAARLTTGAVPSLLAAAEEKDTVVRINAIKALGTLASEKELPTLISFYMKGRSDEEKSTAEKALLMATLRIQDREKRPDAVLAAYASAVAADRASLMRVVGQIVCTKSLDTLRAALKDGDNDVYEVAVRALANWPEVAAAPELLNLAVGAKADGLKLLALRGYIRLVDAADTQEKKLAMFQQAARLVQRIEEKRLLISGLQNNMSTLAGLRSLEPYLADESTRDEAGLAAVHIAERITGPDVPHAREILRRVAETTKSGWVRGQAQRVLGKP